MRRLLPIVTCFVNLCKVHVNIISQIYMIMFLQFIRYSYNHYDVSPYLYFVWNLCVVFLFSDHELQVLNAMASCVFVLSFSNSLLKSWDLGVQSAVCVMMAHKSHNVTFIRSIRMEPRLHSQTWRTYLCGRDWMAEKMHHHFTVNQIVWGFAVNRTINLLFHKPI